MVDAGKYDYVNSSITEENFPVGQGDERIQAVFVHLDRYAETEEVLQEFDRRGLRPATMDELLAFGEQHPDDQRRFPIVALGSVWADPHDYHYVGDLWGRPGRRELNLSWLNYGWRGNCRFLAVHK